MVHVAKRLAQPRSVYVHVPFCQHRCGYCDFSLLTGRDDLVPKYYSSLERELFQSVLATKLTRCTSEAARPRAWESPA